MKKETILASMIIAASHLSNFTVGANSQIAPKNFDHSESSSKVRVNETVRKILAEPAVVELAVPRRQLKAKQYPIEEHRSIAEIEAEAVTMSNSSLRAMASEYKKVLSAKQTEIYKLREKLDVMTFGQYLGIKGQKARHKIDMIAQSLDGLKLRYDIYQNLSIEKSVDVSKLER